MKPMISGRIPSRPPGAVVIVAIVVTDGKRQAHSNVVEMILKPANNPTTDVAEAAPMASSLLGVGKRIGLSGTEAA